MQPKPLTRRTLAAELVEELRAQISAGVLSSGNRIPTEKDLVNSYGVSRTVVREAVARASGPIWGPYSVVESRPKLA